MKIRTSKPPKTKRLIKKPNNCIKVLGGKLKRILLSPCHDISLVITVAFIVLGALCFKNSYIRIGEGFRDIYSSFAHIFTSAEATVNNLSSVSISDLGLLPKDLSLFTAKLRLWWLSLSNGQTYLFYFAGLGRTLTIIILILLFFVAPAICLILVFWIILRIPNNRYNSDTKPLRIAKFISKYTYMPVKQGLKNYFDFLKRYRGYIVAWIAIWSLNFNFFTIILEAIAYYYYFVTSLDFVHLYIQVYKLLLDLSVVITFFPSLAWAIIIIIGLNIFRYHLSLKKLKKNEKKCEETVAQLPVASFVTGPMGTGKTTFNTELAITFNKYFRDVAHKKIFNITMRFPNFPWINVENCIKYGMARHTIYNLATCLQFIKILRKCYEDPDDSKTKLRVNILRSRYNYKYGNFLFDYDYARYGLNYYDQLENADVFDDIEKYAQLYFIYIVSCSFIFASYSIRVDDIQKDEGNFPLWDIDFFRRDPVKIGNNTRRSHILDFDALRIGLRFVEDGKFKDSIDFGVIVVTEIGKERANQKTIKGEYFNFERFDKDGKRVCVTPDNDLFNLDIKECRHRATVDNFPFVVYLLDDNRAASLNADNKELCDLLYIVKASEYKFITPYYALDELVFMAVSNIMIKYFDCDRYYKGNNTLLRHIVRNAYSRLIYKPFERRFNMFAVSKLTFIVQDGKESNKGIKMTYVLSKKKIHAGRFDTACYGDYYYEKTKRSRVGIADVPEYKGKQATRDEMNSTHGFFPHGMDSMFPKKED